MPNRPGQGRKPKATTIRERERRNNREPDPLAKLPHPPGCLDPAARREWRRMGSRLLKAGILSTQLDVATLTVYCATWSRWLAADELVRKGGLVVRTGENIVVSPFLAIAHKERDTMLRIVAEFGMTPASRSRLPASHKRETHKVGEPTKTEGADPRSYLKVLLGNPHGPN